MRWQNIPGWFNPKDVIDYRELVKTIPPKGILIEVGSFAGRSLSSISDILNQNNIKTYAVDIWENWTESPLGKGISKEEFLTNVQDIQELEAIQMTSVEAGKILLDKKIKADGIFLDATHAYDSVVEDIKTWMPLLKAGGWIGGHDFHPSWPGVPKAVTEIFGQDFLAPRAAGGTVWSHYLK